MNIAFIPIDNRPVCYLLPKQIADINNEINLILPDRKFLGGLTEYSDVEAIFDWLKNLQNIDVVVMCLDTIAYGGLISSRRCKLSFKEIKERIFKLKRILEEKNAKIYAFSSIMRISNNNVNQEEKEYWAYFGKKIFEYSYNFHKNGKTETDVPQDILKDYLETRKRNFDINKIYLEWKKEGFFDTLVFSKDDCAEFGLNVMEADELKRLGGFVKTGADEIPITLLANAINKKIKVAPIFLAPEHKHLISNYEDISIEQSVLGQLQLAGCEVVEPNDADILLYINNFEDRQGEIVMKVPTKPFDGNWETIKNSPLSPTLPLAGGRECCAPSKPYLIADVRYANGADNAFVEKLFEVGFDENFLGYSAWNTSANTLGSLICQGIVACCRSALLCRQKNLMPGWQSRPTSFRPFNHSTNTPPHPNPLPQGEGACDNSFSIPQPFNSSTDNGLPSCPPALLPSIITRFLDDWAYQANVRQMLTEPDPEKCKELMKPFEERLWKIFGIRYNVNYKFPWNRLFEVEIELS